jgi:hypothetical protein
MNDQLIHQLEAVIFLHQNKEKVIFVPQNFILN